MMNVRPAAQSPDSVFYRENPINIPHWGKGGDFAPPSDSHFIHPAQDCSFEKGKES